MYCESCGSPLSDTARFCKFCGASVESLPSSGEPALFASVTAGRRSLLRPWVYWVLGLAGVGAAALAVWPTVGRIVVRRATPRVTPVQAVEEINGMCREANRLKEAGQITAGTALSFCSDYNAYRATPLALGPETELLSNYLQSARKAFAELRRQAASPPPPPVSVEPARPPARVLLRRDVYHQVVTRSIAGEITVTDVSYEFVHREDPQGFKADEKVDFSALDGARVGWMTIQTLVPRNVWGCAPVFKAGGEDWYRTGYYAADRQTTTDVCLVLDHAIKEYHRLRSGAQ